MRPHESLREQTALPIAAISPNLRRMIRNVIFDWSGTLVNDLPAVLQATNHVFESLGLTPFSLDRFRDEFQLPYHLFYQRHAPNVPLADLETLFVSKFLELEDTVELLPKAMEFLQFCRDRKQTTFLLSTIPEFHYRKQAPRLGIESYIDHPYTGVPDKTQRIGGLIKEHALDPNETLFVGDMEHDIETARLAGVRSCAVLTGYNTMKQLKAASPDLLVEHLGELQSTLLRHSMRVPSIDEAVSESVPGDKLPLATVGGLILNERNEALMIQTDKWSGLWGIPGGKIQWGEAHEDALIREVKEETGLDITDIQFVMVQDCLPPNEFYKEAHFVLLNYLARVKGEPEVALNEEARRYQWIAFDQCETLPLNKPTLLLVREIRERRFLEDGRA